MGCFTDSNSVRDFFNSISTLNSQMTTLQCIGYCKAAGYNYAAIQNS